MTGVARRVGGPARSPPSCGCVARRQRDEAQVAVRSDHRRIGRHRRIGARDADAVVRNARRALRTADRDPLRPTAPSRQRPGHAAGTDPAGVAQTRSRLAGVMPDAASRMVSFHDPDARPIRKGRLGKPVEFGYKAQVVDNDDGVILDHTVEIGNPADGPQLALAIATHRQPRGRAPRRSPPTAATASLGGDPPARARRAHGGHSPCRVNPVQLGGSSNTEKPSAARSNGEPDAKVGSTTLNAVSAGTAPN